MISFICFSLMALACLVVMGPEARGLRRGARHDNE
jgi:hypothetical protein